MAGIRHIDPKALSFFSTSVSNDSHVPYPSGRSDECEHVAIPRFGLPVALWMSVTIHATAPSLLDTTPALLFLRRRVSFRVDFDLAYERSA
jgi:hypothetical protein